MASMITERPGSGKAALSIDVEDWFHTANLNGVIAREAWDQCELRVERNTMRMLEILDAGNARACIEARLQSPAKMVEIRVTAAK